MIEFDILQVDDGLSDCNHVYAFAIQVSWDRMNSMADRLKNDADNQVCMTYLFIFLVNNLFACIVTSLCFYFLSKPMP